MSTWLDRSLIITTALFVPFLRQMFGGQHSDDIKEHRGLHADPESEADSERDAETALKESSGWQPSFNPEPSYTKPRVPKTHHRDRPSSATSQHNLPYESYTTSARYKEQKSKQQHDQQQLDPSIYEAYNGEEWHASDGKANHGHGNGYRPADMYSSSTSASVHRSKKPKSNGSASSASSSSSTAQSNAHKKRQKKRRPTPTATATSNGKDKTKHGKKSRSLETELRPPPAGILY